MAFEFIYDIFNGVVAAISNGLGPWNDYPLAAILILLLTIIMSAISAAATRALVDVDVMRRRNVELKEWQTAYSAAMRSKDEKAIAKLKKKEPAIKRVQTEMSKDQFKPLMVTMIPFFLFYYIFAAVFGNNQLIVAYSPLDIPFVGSNFNFWIWYFITSFSVSPLIQRLFGMPNYTD